MFPWRRIIACLLILVFAPASVLAATPFKLCFGADGHRAIESAVAQHHHGSPNIAAVAVETFKQTMSKSASNTDCYDVGVLDNEQGLKRTASKPIEPKKIIGIGDTLIRFPQVYAGNADCDSAPVGHAEDGVIARDPHLASLATIVLLN